MLDVRDLTVQYGALRVLDQLSCSVEAGEWLMIVGPNGAGKSTALSAIAQAVPYTGTVTLDGRNARCMRARERARFMGVLTQTHSAQYAFTVEEVVRMGRYAHSGVLSASDDRDSRAVEQALTVTGMAHCRRHSVLTLSGGELQRVYLAQVFAQEPRLLLLDEPTNHLDLMYQKQTFDLIRTWLQTSGRAAVSVVHDLSLAMRYGTSALLLHQGRTLACGSVRRTLSPDTLRAAYGLDVHGWMRTLLSGWMEEPEGSAASEAETPGGRILPDGHDPHSVSLSEADHPA